jgi:serine/threonine protein kinase
MFAAPAGTELVAPLPSGSVFQVARVRLAEGREAVCKRLLPRVRDEPAARAALVREAGALAIGRHRSMPDLLRVGSDGHGPFVIEGLVDGLSLRAIAEAYRARGAHVPERLVAHLAMAAADALAEVHAIEKDGRLAGLSHGDLGPDHVWMRPDGSVGFVDFGAARHAAMDPALESADRGTLPFVAPEVARGEARPGQDHDTYALAATLLFFAGSGSPLVAARDDASMLLEVGEHGLSRDLVDRATGLSGGARDALGRAIALDPAARLRTARELAAALSR